MITVILWSILVASTLTIAIAITGWHYRRHVFMIVLVLLATAMPLYWLLGASQSLGLIDKLQRMDTQLARLSEVLRVHKPDDVNGWLLVAQQYSSIERKAQALAAIEQAYIHGGNNDPRVLLLYAALLGNDTPQTATLLEQALAVDSSNDVALRMRIDYALHNNQPTVALTALRQLASILGETHEDYQAIQQVIAALDWQQQLHIPITITTDTPEKFVGWTLFAFARSTGEAANTPPLLARRMTIDKWPVTITLNANDLLREPPVQATQFTVGIRLSKQGDALDTDAATTTDVTLPLEKPVQIAVP